MGILSHTRAQIEAKFWANVQKTSHCWEWTGTKSKTGYGVLYTPHKTTDSRRRIFAHRFVHELYHGPIPEGMLVCHHCDNPGCVNPDHLWLGSDQENTADRHRKGRTVTGEKHTQAKVSEADVLLIRAKARTGRSYASLAREFSLSLQQVSRIVRRVNWKYL